MFFDRTKELLEEGGQMIRAEAELATLRLRRAIVSSALLLGVLCVAGAGLGMLVAGATVALARRAGTPEALAVVGGSLTLMATVVLVVARLLNRAAAAEVHEHASTDDTDAKQTDTPNTGASNPLPQSEKSQMHKQQQPQSGSRPEPASRDREHTSSKGGSSKGASEVDVKMAAVDFVANNPAAVGSAVFLALSVIGPGRAIRLLSRGAAAAGLVSTVMDRLRDDQPEQQPDPAGETRT